MKTFDLEFYRSHKSFSNTYIRMRAQAKSVERLLPRIKKILKELEKLPNPYSHTQWLLYKVEEIK